MGRRMAKARRWPPNSTPDVFRAFEVEVLINMNEVIALQDGRVGRLRLNRPKPIHALNLNMVQLMTDALRQWQQDPALDLIMIDHAEGRGFCAGGDVVSIAQNAQSDGPTGDAFFYEEYRLNHLMYTYAKPGIVFMDGITMGGGVGIAGPCKYRIATERTIFSMPESGIGLFPDVGGGRYLSRLPGRMPQFLGLTGARLKARICADPSQIEAILAEVSVTPPPAPILERLGDINRLFAADRLEDVFTALEADDGEWAKQELAKLRTKSPLSCKVTLRLLLVSPHLKDFADEMRLEFGIVHRLFRCHDFAEGVRALLIDRDNSPKWDPATPEGVTDQMVNAIFQPMHGKDAWQPL